MPHHTFIATVNINNIFLKSFRVLLLPFALLYGGIVWVRNYLFDKQIIKSASFGLPVICVGNLAVGGTGKTPMVEYMLAMLLPRFKVATLSRGYKRKTKGYVLAGPATTALEIGDEPMQFHQKFKNAVVAVGEERMVAIPQLLQDRPQTEVIILDDAFQHRAVKAGLNILLTEYANPFYDDWFLPTGDLRDMRKSYRRAQLVVVTKCPEQLTAEKAAAMRQCIAPLPRQQVFFTRIAYGQPYHLFTNEPCVLNEQMEVLLVCGIANPLPLKQYINERVASYEQITYSDHHLFTDKDLKTIAERYQKMEGTNTIIITTEKDATRLYKFGSQMAHLPVYVLPITHQFLFGQSIAFQQAVEAYVLQNRRTDL